MKKPNPSTRSFYYTLADAIRCNKYPIPKGTIAAIKNQYFATTTLSNSEKNAKRIIKLNIRAMPSAESR